ncbi:MAG: vitamin K epoxide reductase family protein [Candidatus Saccharimonadales bacterium]
MLRKLVKKIDKLGLLLLLGGAVGFVASFVLTIDKVKLLQNPNYVPPCNINPIISCGSVMKTSQASVFGFANSLIGVAAFAAVMAIGLAIIADAKFKKWFWQLIEFVALIGLIFAHWLIYQSLYVLGTLCPYCVGVWIVVIPIFWYITLYNFKAGNLPSIIRLNRIAKFLYKHHGDVLLAWYLVILVLILNRFWYYWQTLL